MFLWIFEGENKEPFSWNSILRDDAFTTFNIFFLHVEIMQILSMNLVDFYVFGEEKSIKLISKTRYKEMEFAMKRKTGKDEETSAKFL